MTRPVIALTVILATLTGASQVHAQEPTGCDKFKWDVARERAALDLPNTAKLPSGSEISAPLPQTVTLDLKSTGDAKLPMPPERTPKPGTFAGFSTLNAIPASGTYSISLSSAAWVDVVQNGGFLKPKAFSGVTGCDGIRKTMKFDLAPGPVTIQLSGVSESSIRMAVMPVSE